MIDFNQGISMRQQELHPRTAVINKAQKKESKKARNGALSWLAATFPAVFDTTLSIQPLKIGIIDDILAYADQAQTLGISRSKLREAVAQFARRIDYLACIKAREMRVDLLGNPVCQVTEDEAERAALKIKKRVEKSARNARQEQNGKIIAQKSPLSKQTASTDNDMDPHFVERPPMFSVQANTATKSTAVIVTHKNTRQYDPDAVARLKEKLGLTRKKEREKEKESTE